MEESKGKILTGDLLRILDLQQELASIKQGDTSIIDYFTKLRVIGDELENYRPEPICTCATKKCSCDVLKTVKQRKTQDQVMQLLCGLNDQYSHVKSNILMMDPLPIINKVFSFAVQQERQFNGTDALGN